jgi:hypothetical protein
MAPRGRLRRLGLGCSRSSRSRDTPRQKCDTRPDTCCSVLRAGHLSTFLRSTRTGARTSCRNPHSGTVLATGVCVGRRAVPLHATATPPLQSHTLPFVRACIRATSPVVARAPCKLRRGGGGGGADATPLPAPAVPVARSFGALGGGSAPQHSTPQLKRLAHSARRPLSCARAPRGPRGRACHGRRAQSRRRRTGTRPGAARAAAARAAQRCASLHRSGR